MRSALLFLMPAILLAACGGEGADAPEASDAAMPSETDAAPAPELVGAWTVEYIDDRPVIDNSPAYIEFDAEGQVSGSATCNRMTGAYVQENRALMFRPMAVTRRMCPEALMEQEQRFLEALDRVRYWRVENGLLVLEDGDGGMVFRASPRADEG